MASPLSLDGPATATAAAPGTILATDRSGGRGSPRLTQLLRWLLGITRPVHGPLLISAMCRIVALSLDLALFATAAGAVVHVVTSDGNTAGLIVALVVLALSKATFFYLEQFSGHYVAFKALELLRTHVFATLWPKAPAIVTHSRSADILTSLTRDVDRIEVVYAHTFAPVVSAYVVGPAAVIIAGSVVGWSPVAVAAGCLAISLLVVPYFGMRRAMATTRLTLEQRRDLSHQISDSVFGIDEVLGYGRDGERTARMDLEGIAISRSARIPRDMTGLRRGANVLLSLVAAISVVWIGTDPEYSLSPAVVAALAAGAIRLFEGPRGVEDAVGYLDHSLAAARRLWEISNAPERVGDGARVLELRHAPAIRFEGVSYAYPRTDGSEPTDALHDIDLEIEAGEHCVLLGHSGSGKSTMVQLLLRYDDPRSGRITIDGEPITDYTLDSLRHDVVVVSQRNQLMDRSLAENLRLGASDATDDELWGMLDLVGLGGEVASMPDGLATAVGPNGSALSGGQAQRVCLARALLMKPRVLVLDEFTANLNIELEAEIRAALASWQDELTIVEVSHREQALASADIVARIDRGRLVDVHRRGSDRSVTSG